MSEHIPFDVGTVFRLKLHGRYHVWQVTGVHIGALGHENLTTLRVLTNDHGSVHGKTQQESMVPTWILDSHPMLERFP